MSVAFAPLRLVAPARPLRVVDVALFYGERSGGIRTYLDAKAAYAARTGAFEHRLVVPGDVPSVCVAPNNGYRWPLGSRPLVDRLRELEPDVVLLHDPFWAPRAAVSAARSVGARVVMVHHGSLELDANALPGPNRAVPARARRVAAARVRRTSTPSCPRATRSATPGARRRCRCASGSTRRSSRPASRSAATTCCTPAGSAARRASSSCSRPPPARRSRGRCG